MKCFSFPWINRLICLVAGSEGGGRLRGAGVQPDPRHQPQGSGAQHRRRCLRLPAEGLPDQRGAAPAVPDHSPAAQGNRNNNNNNNNSFFV